MATLESVPPTTIPRVVAEAAYDGLRDAKDRRIAELEDTVVRVIVESQSYRAELQAALDMLRAEQLRAGRDRRQLLELRRRDALAARRQGDRAA